MPDDKYYSTIQMTMLGNKLYLLGRGSKKIHLFEYDSETNHWKKLAMHAEFTDAQCWDKKKYYSTIQMATINNKLVVFGRGANNKYFSTIQIQVINDKLCVFGRGASELHLFEYDPTTNNWQSLARHPVLADASGWDQEKYYKTIQTAVIDNKLYVFGRGANETHLFEYDPSTNSWLSLPRFPMFGDASHWDQEKYYQTLQTTVINNKLYLFGRGASELHLLEYDPTTKAWKDLARHPVMADASHWDQEQYYKTIQSTVINNKLYIFGRGGSELHLFEYDPLTNHWQNLSGYPELSDAAGWDKMKYYSTIQLAVKDNKLYVLGRGADEIHLFEYDTSTNHWQSLKRYPVFMDHDGWGGNRFCDVVDRNDTIITSPYV